MTQEEINFAETIMPENGLHLGTMGGSSFEFFAGAVSSLAQSLQCSSSSSSSQMTVTQKDITYTVSVTNTAAKRHGTTTNHTSVPVVKWWQDLVRTKKKSISFKCLSFSSSSSCSVLFSSNRFPCPFCSVRFYWLWGTVGLLSFVLFDSCSQRCHTRQNQNTLLLSTQNTNPGQHLKTFLRTEIIALFWLCLWFLYKHSFI